MSELPTVSQAGNERGPSLPASVVLAATHHDPDGRMYDQTARALPALLRLFAGVAIRTTYATQARSVELLRSLGAVVMPEAVAEYTSLAQLGLARRVAIKLALTLDAPFTLLADLDRALHWVERYPEELADLVAHAGDQEFLVLGRSARAFASHPRTQRDTESIVNQVFASLSGQSWDVTAAARIISRRAARAILDGCPDQSIGVDMTWPLFLQRAGECSLGYVETEGLEFETADRYPAEIAQAGGLEAWLAQLEADPRRWVERLDVARVEIEAALPYR